MDRVHNDQKVIKFAKLAESLGCMLPILLQCVLNQNIQIFQPIYTHRNCSWLLLMGVYCAPPSDKILKTNINELINLFQTINHIRM